MAAAQWARPTAVDGIPAGSCSSQAPASFQLGGPPGPTIPPCLLAPTVRKPTVRAQGALAGRQPVPYC